MYHRHWYFIGLGVLETVLAVLAFLSFLSEVEQLKPEDYQTDGWEFFSSILSRAQYYATNQAYFDHHYVLLNYAMDLLVPLAPPLPDTTRLQELITYASSVSNDGYTTESWQTLQSSITQAKSLLSQSSYTKEEVDAACIRIENALNGLSLKPPPGPDPEPSDHRYLIDGILPSDLLPAKDAIFDNIKWGRNAGLWLFIPMLIVWFGVRVARNWVSVWGEPM